MGLCISTKAASPETVKMILPDGDLKEFSWSIRPSYILGKDEESSFVCDSDSMEIGSVIKKVGGEKELRLGQIYFVLPNSMLNRPLKAEEMAKLVVRASNALAKINGGKKGRKGVVVPLTFSMVEEEEMETEKKIVGKKGSSKRRSFKSDLSAIAEIDREQLDEDHCLDLDGERIKSTAEAGNDMTRLMNSFFFLILRGY
ncbi:hypothetical protein LUZ60_010436 [Juncus effusus]|nr:hypothetical protein LUZ60_010436 [Juncus effusus]